MATNLLLLHKTFISRFFDASQSYMKGAVSPVLKNQYITPIFKKGPKSLKENYRPVSITSHLTKVFERLIRRSVADHIDKLELHSENQHGFRKGRSTMSQLLTHVDYILSELCSNRGGLCGLFGL